jgi:hypothetical protein
MLAILPRRQSVRIFTVLGIVALFAAFLRSALYTPTFSKGDLKTSIHGTGRGSKRVTITRMRTAWAETTRTVMTGSEPTAHSGDHHDPLQQHHYRSDGLLEVNPEGSHPIFELIENAEAEWEAKLASSSKTLTQAVAEYQRRYKRLPPLGFDDWFVTVTSIVPQINIQVLFIGGHTLRITTSSCQTSMIRSTRI